MRVVGGVGIGGEGAPVLDRALPLLARRRLRAALEVGEGRLVGGDHPGAGAPLDRHVADRHALLHRQRPDRVAGVLDHVADPARDPDLPDRAQDHVLGGESGRQVADELEQHRLRAPLVQRLRREHVLDLRGADAERERTEGAVRRGVAVTADDRLPGLRDPELGADHVDDALAARSRRVQLDAELLAVGAQRVELRLRHLVGHRPRQGRDVVVHRRDRQVGPPHAPAGEPQPLERLRRGDLVHEVQVDVEQRRLTGLVADDVPVPDLVEQAPARHQATSTSSTNASASASIMIGS